MRILILTGFLFCGMGCCYGQATVGRVMAAPMDYNRVARLKELQLYHAQLLNHAERLNEADRQKRYNDCGAGIRTFMQGQTYPSQYADGTYAVQVFMAGELCEKTTKAVRNNRIVWDTDPGQTVVSSPIRNGVGKVLVAGAGQSTVIEFYFVY